MEILVGLYLLVRSIFARPVPPPGADRVREPKREERHPPANPASACLFSDSRPRPVVVVFNNIALTFPSHEAAQDWYAMRNAELVLHAICKNPINYGRVRPVPVA